MVMIVRKPSSLLAAINSIHSFACSPVHSSTSSNPRRRDTHPATCRRKGYATIASDDREASTSQSQPSSEPSESSRPQHQWPEAPKGSSTPTPYQIFDMKHDGKYTKALYYRLVKIYHPDLHGNGHENGSHDISHNVKMERYRLIVAAHSILSDPVKRSAYDRFGAGWNGRAEVGVPETWAKPSPFHAAGPFSQSWHDPSDPVWQNATWEDWERYRQNKAGTGTGKRAPVYMANSYFLALVIALAIIGSSLNVGRAQEAGTYIVESRDLVHDRAAKNLRQVRKETEGLTNRQDRIDFFVRQREAALGTGDHQALREEKANRILKDREVCYSENVRGRDT